MPVSLFEKYTLTKVKCFDENSTIKLISSSATEYKILTFYHNTFE